MEFKILGFKFRLEVVLISMILGCVICCHVLCNCVTKEGLNTLGSSLDYVMNKGVHQVEYAKIDRPYEVAMGPSVPLPEGQMFLFANNDYHPDCCSYSNVSSSNLRLYNQRTK